MPIQIKKVNWECPGNIKAFHTTRIGGSSKGLFKYSNLSFDVGDGQTNVKKYYLLTKKSSNFHL